jgi:hypothetical protein
MKKKSPKLSLHRETLASLSSDRMENVAGGVPETYVKSCLLSCFGTCSAIGCTDGCPSYLIGGC